MNNTKECEPKQFVIAAISTFPCPVTVVEGRLTIRAKEGDFVYEYKCTNPLTWSSRWTKKGAIERGQPLRRC